MTIHSKDGLSGQTKLERISELSVKDRGMVFNNLGHLLDCALLMKTYALQDKTKAVGIDGVTKEEYGKNLAKNVKELLIRIRRGTYRSKPAQAGKRSQCFKASL
jgi:RNA-directed DNA polymerase